MLARLPCTFSVVKTAACRSTTILPRPTTSTTLLKRQFHNSEPPETYSVLDDRSVKSTRPPPHPKVRGQSKLFSDADEAVKDIQSGSVILSAGFGLCGTAETILHSIHKRKDTLKNLTAVTNNAGAGIEGGLAPLVNDGQVNSVILSYLGNNKELEKLYIRGDVSLELCPQGTLAERLRAGGVGIPAFYTPTGYGTDLQTGDIPIRLGPKNAEGKQTVLCHGHVRETREFTDFGFEGRQYLLEHAIKGHVAVLRAYKVDEAGNCVFRRTTKTFGSLMARAASLTIVEAENIVKTGEIDPDDVHLAGIFVDRIVPATKPKLIEVLKTSDEYGEQENKSNENVSEQEMSPAEVRRRRIAKRAARELKHGYYVNLGVGMPTLAPSYLDPEVKVWIQSENGILGMGPYPKKDEVDPDLINAGKETVTLVPGASTFDSSESFGMIRGGHIDVSMLGALQVSASGDLANYMIPGKVIKGMGGAMDLVSNPEETKIVVLTDHVNKHGKPKIVDKCSLPLTGARVVSRIITDLCVFDVDRVNGGLTLIELAPGVDIETVKENTGCEFEVADSLGSME